MVQFTDKTEKSTLDDKDMDHHKEVISTWSNGDVLLGVLLVGCAVTLFWEQDKWEYTFQSEEEALDFYKGVS